MNCPFCTIDSLRNRTVKEGRFVTVVFSNPRLMPGHLLVIPKRHVETIADLDASEQHELFQTVVEFQEKILERVSSGCDIRQHYRPFQKQDHIKADHLHIHLLPRELYDELYQKCQVFETGIFQKTTSEECDEVLSALGKGG